MFNYNVYVKRNVNELQNFNQLHKKSKTADHQIYLLY